MAKLTQKDLIQRSLYQEGIGSMLKQAARTGVGRIGKTARAIGSMAAPKTSAALSKLGQAISSDFVEVMGANPKNGLRSWLNTPEGQRLFKNVSLGREKKLANNDININFKGQYIDPKTPNEPKDVSGTFTVRKEDEGKWGILGANSAQGEVLWAPSKTSKKKKGSGKQNKEEVVSNTPRTASTKSRQSTTTTRQDKTETKTSSSSKPKKQGVVGRVYDKYKDAVVTGAKKGAQDAAEDRGISPDQVEDKTREVVDDVLDGEEPKSTPPSLPKPKVRERSTTEDATYRRILRAIKSRKMPKRRDVEEYINTHGKNAKNKIGGVPLRSLLKKKDQLREKISQKNPIRLLTLLSR